MGKREIGRNEQFLHIPQCFLPVWKSFCHFHQILNCRLQTVSDWKCLKFVVWEGVKELTVYRYQTTKKFDLNKSNVFADEKSSLFFKKVVNGCGKRRKFNVGYQHFLLFSQTFSKSYPESC